MKNDWDVNWIIRENVTKGNHCVKDFWNNLEVDEENPNRNENEGTTRCGCGWIKSFLSIFNPWSDLEEIEDFFQEKDY